MYFVQKAYTFSSKIHKVHRHDRHLHNNHSVVLESGYIYSSTEKVKSHKLLYNKMRTEAQQCLSSLTVRFSTGTYGKGVRAIRKASMGILRSTTRTLKGESKKAKTSTLKLKTPSLIIFQKTQLKKTRISTLNYQNGK